LIKLSNSYENNMAKGVKMGYAVMNCTHQGKNGLVRRKDILSKLPKCNLQGFIVKIDSMRKKDFDGAPNRFWVHVSSYLKLTL